MALSLISQIGRHPDSPARILEDVAHDGVRHAAVVITHADVTAPDLVPLSNLPDVLHQLILGFQNNNKYQVCRKG